MKAFLIICFTEFIIANSIIAAGVIYLFKTGRTRSMQMAGYIMSLLSVIMVIILASLGPQAFILSSYSIIFALLSSLHALKKCGLSTKYTFIPALICSIISCPFIIADIYASSSSIAMCFIVLFTFWFPHSLLAGMIINIWQIAFRRRETFQMKYKVFTYSAAVFANIAFLIILKLIKY